MYVMALNVHSDMACGENIWTSQTEQFDAASISSYLEKCVQLTVLTTCSQHVSEITAYAGNAFRSLAHISVNLIIFVLENW